MIKKILIMIAIVGIVLFFILIGINFYVILNSSSKIINVDELKIKDEKDIDAILILGAGVNGTTPSHMLEDRLLEGINLYNNGVADKIIMSGDHGKADYDEVNIMKKFAIDKGIPSENIFMDHAGFSTYESIYRAKEIFGAEKIVVVTQKYHLYRAIYISKSLGIEVYGVGSDPRTYVKQMIRETREVFARNKDFFTSIIKPKPTYLGEKISLDGSGDVTNDK